MKQKTELINLSKAKKLILLKAYFQDETQASAIINTLDNIQLNKWIKQNQAEIDEKLREQSLENNTCWKCGKSLNCFSYNQGEDYAVECLNCDMLYFES